MHCASKLMHVTNLAIFSFAEKTWIINDFYISLSSAFWGWFFYFSSVLFAAYLELLLLYHYGYSDGEDGEAPSRTHKLQNGKCSNKNVHISILTPINPSQRGCQLSVKFSVSVKAVHNELEKRGVVVSPVVSEGNLHERSSCWPCEMLWIKIWNGAIQFRGEVTPLTGISTHFTFINA